MHQWRILYYTEEHINPWSLSAQKFVLSEAAQAHVGDFKLSRTRTRQRLTYRKPSETFPTKLLHLFRSAFHLPSFKHHIGLQTEKKKKKVRFWIQTSQNQTTQTNPHLLAGLQRSASAQRAQIRGNTITICYYGSQLQLLETNRGLAVTVWRSVTALYPSRWRRRWLVLMHRCCINSSQTKSWKPNSRSDKGNVTRWWKSNEPLQELGPVSNSAITNRERAVSAEPGSIQTLCWAAREPVIQVLLISPHETSFYRNTAARPKAESAF